MLKQIFLTTFLIASSAFFANLRAAAFALLSIFCTGAFAQNSCLDSNIINDTRLPVCEASSEIAMPDASMPTAAVFLSLIVSRNEETIVKTLEKIKKHSPETKLNVLVSKNAMTLFKSYAAYCKPTGNEGSYEYLCKLASALIEEKQINVIVLSKERDQVYPQDYLQFGIKDNLPILLPTINPWETQDYINSDGSPIAKTYIKDDIANQCNIRSSSLDISDPVGFSSTMGGNIESLPFGISVMGYGQNEDLTKINAMSDDELFKKMKEVYPPNISDVQIRDQIKRLRKAVSTLVIQKNHIMQKTGNLSLVNTTLTPVGHADETFSIVRSNAKCGFSILVPSPSIAIQLLKSTPPNETKESCISKVFNGSSTFDGIDKGVLDKHSNSGCIGFRGKVASEVLSDKELIDLNMQFDSYTEQNIKVIAKVLSEKCSELDIVKLPYLISKSDQASSEGIFPNPVNALVITPLDKMMKSIYINNPTFVKIFDEHIDQKLTSKGLNIEKVFSSPYFSGQGGIHCGSSTIQLCRQK